LAMITGVQYSERYTTKSSICGIFEEYEKSIEIFKEKLWKKETLVLEKQAVNNK